MEIQNWQKGNDCELTSLQRMELHTEWLKEQHKQVRDTIIKKLEQDKPKEIILGFPKG